MKALAILIALALPAAASQAEPTRAELLQTVQHISRLAKEQQADLDAAHEHEKSLETNLQSVLKELGETQATLVTVQTEINTLAQHDANETADKKHILTKYHRLKAIACAIAAAAAIFLIMRLTSFLPTFMAQYKIYLYAGAGIGAATLVATLL